MYSVHKRSCFYSNSGGALGKNHKRVMDVWMDEYKEYVYIRRPHYRNLDPGMLCNHHLNEPDDYSFISLDF